MQAKAHGGARQGLRCGGRRRCGSCCGAFRGSRSLRVGTVFSAPLIGQHRREQLPPVMVASDDRTLWRVTTTSAVNIREGSGRSNVKEQTISAGGRHAAALSCGEGLHGSIASNRSIWSSLKPVSSECRQPVARKMWMASDRDGTRFSLTISLA